MPDKASHARSEKGQTRIAVMAALLVLVPLGTSVISRVIPNKAGSSAGVFLERPDPKYKSCVRDPAYMRLHHWELLRGIREEVVRYGIRGETGLSRCPECHTSRERFCNRCHDAVSLTPDCFDCHYYP